MITLLMRLWKAIVGLFGGGGPGEEKARPMGGGGPGEEDKPPK